MTGIYRITNRANGRTYIGESKNIKKRFRDHIHGYSSAKRLQEDMRRYGPDGFKFEVAEECDESELLEREAAYIAAEQPYYNVMGKGDGEFNRKVSAGTKKWWESLSDATKEKIITKNLTGPPKGHAVSQETREKISRTLKAKPGKRVMIVETGEVFEKVGLLENRLGACTGTYAAYRKGKIKTVKGYHVVEV